jgi:hypothetical protein
MPIDWRTLLSSDEIERLSNFNGFDESRFVEHEGTIYVSANYLAERIAESGARGYHNIMREAKPAYYSILKEFRDVELGQNDFVTR